MSVTPYASYIIGARGVAGQSDNGEARAQLPAAAVTSYVNHIICQFSYIMSGGIICQLHHDGEASAQPPAACVVSVTSLSVIVYVSYIIC